MMASTSKCALNKKTASILKALYYLNNNQRKAILKSADRALVRAICECIFNVLSGNIQISIENKKRLNKHKTILRKLTNPQKKRSWVQRKKILIQKGSVILPFLIQPVMSILLSKLLEKNGERT